MKRSPGYDLLYTGNLKSTVQAEEIIKDCEHFVRSERTHDDIHGCRVGVWFKDSWGRANYFRFLLREGLALISFCFQVYKLEKPKALLRYIKLMKRKGVL